MRIRFSGVLDRVEYAIRELAPLARRLEASGRRILYLNIGDPLKYDFETPRHIIDAFYRASMVHGSNYYSESQGLRELRGEVSRFEYRVNRVDVDPEYVFITQGVSEGLSFTARILLDPGSEALVPSPSYPLYYAIPYIYDSKPVEYRLIEGEGWMPDIDDLRRKISDRTKYIVVSNPNNPTGTIIDEKYLRMIIDVAGEYGLPIVSDEIYSLIYYDSTKPSSPARLSKDVPVFVLNGFSKAFLMTGWRLGYLYIHDPIGDARDEARDKILKLAMLRLSPNTPGQYAAIEALRGPLSHIDDMRHRIRGRVKLFIKYLSNLDYVRVVEPKGAFYIFPRLDIGMDDRRLVLDLLREEGVFIVNGSGFGSMGTGHVRIVTLPPEEVISEAMDKISRFLERHIVESI